MFSITLEAKHRTLFAKECTLLLAKERVTNEFREHPDFHHAIIYDQATRCEIERGRGENWRKVAS